MLRLTLVKQTSKESVVKVEGWFSGPNVSLLTAEGNRLLGQSPRLVLELTGICHIDGAGLDLLKGWWGQRLALRGAPGFVAALLGQRGLICETT
jgi:hypothetical protein